MSGPVIAAERDADGLWWVSANGQQLVGYQSKTRAEMFAAGYAARLEGKPLNPYSTKATRPGVHQRRARDAWKEGWLIAKELVS